MKGFLPWFWFVVAMIGVVAMRFDIKHMGQLDAAVAQRDSLQAVVDEMRGKALADSFNIATMRGMLDEWNVYFFTGKAPSFAEDGR